MFAIVALQCHLSAGVVFLEDFALEKAAMTLVFQLCIEVHGSSCMKQEVHYVMTWTKQPHVLQKQSLASVKSKNVPQMETSSNIVRAWRNRACNVESSSSLLGPGEVLGDPQQATRGAAGAGLQDLHVQISLPFPPRE